VCFKEIKKKPKVEREKPMPNDENNKNKKKIYQSMLSY
jgi:hypothetical protein